MFTLVVAGGHMLQRVDRVRMPGVGQKGAGTQVGWQRRGDVPHGPRAAQVQAIEVAELWVGSVRDHRNRQQVPGLAVAHRRQVRLEPPGELLGDSTRRIRSASTSAGDRKSEPLGSSFAG